MSTTKKMLLLAASSALFLTAVLAADRATGGAERTLSASEAAGIYGGDMTKDRECLRVPACLASAAPCNERPAGTCLDLGDETVPNDDDGGQGEDCSLPSQTADCDDSGGNSDCAYVYECYVERDPAKHPDAPICLRKANYKNAVRAPTWCSNDEHDD